MNVEIPHLIYGMQVYMEKGLKGLNVRRIIFYIKKPLRYTKWLFNLYDRGCIKTGDRRQQVESPEHHRIRVLQQQLLQLLYSQVSFLITEWYQQRFQ